MNSEPGMSALLVAIVTLFAVAGLCAWTCTGARDQAVTDTDDGRAGRDCLMCRLFRGLPPCLPQALGLVLLTLGAATLSIVVLYGWGTVGFLGRVLLSGVGALWDGILSSPTVLVCVFGGAVGIAELVARYRDDPERALRTLPAWLYVLLNAFAGAVALDLIDRFEVFADTENPRQRVANEVLLAGFGAMVFFRSALFTVRVGGTDVGVGPAGVLQAILQAADRAIDRDRAARRAPVVKTIMSRVSFALGKEALPALCGVLMQNLSPEDRATLGRTVRDLEALRMNDDQRSLNLGLALMNMVGEDVLRNAVDILAPGIDAHDPCDLKKQFPAVQSLFDGVPFERARDALPVLCTTLAPRLAGDERDRIAAVIADLEQLPLASREKLIAIGCALIPLVGMETVEVAVALLKSSPSAEDAPPPGNTTDPSAKLVRTDFDRWGKDFVGWCFDRAGLSPDDARRAETDDILTEIATNPAPMRMVTLAARMIDLVGKEAVKAAVADLP